ncbi:hypothetical protein V3C99_000593 [Haemonchus contortus]|uniref:SH3 domain-containing protein n=1 Tax=Haemonchus contortus TaxID=6289 RepID=A0A7I4YGD0_HAECO
MNARMSRLRRSLSRSVQQLSLSRSSSLNGLIELPTSSYTTLVDKFASPTNFEQLRQLVQHNNDALREIITAFEEKAALDFHYSKSLKKISANLHRVTQLAESDIDKGWTSVAEQFDVQATIHSNLGSALTDDVVQPLRSIQLTEAKTIRAAALFVERETRKLKDARDATIRKKRLLYESSKQLEKLEQSLDQQNNGERVSLKKKRLEDQVKKQEEAYVWDTVDLEKQRRVTEGVLRKGVESLEAVERQRLAHCQTALGRYQRKIEQLGPNLQQMFDRHTNNLDVAVQATAADYIAGIQPSTAAVNHIILTDVYMLDGELQRMYAQGRADTQICNTRQITLVEFLEYLFYKINDAINALDGGQHRGYHRLVRFQHKTKDKAGLPTTVLTIPLAGEDQSLPPPSIASNTGAYSVSVTSPRSSCEEYEEYDKISDEGFYNSSSRQTTVIDEPATHSTLCRVLYDFEPKHDDEIQVRAGECVVVEDRLGDDWLIGHVISEQGADYKTGRFPTSYVAF